MHELKPEFGAGRVQISLLMYPPEAPAIPGTMRQCPLCRELMDEEDWMLLPRHETTGTFGKTTKLTCPECHRQSLSIQWQARRQRKGAVP